MGPFFEFGLARGSCEMTAPGVEPGLSRPRRDVLTTRRCGPWWVGCRQCGAYGDRDDDDGGGNDDPQYKYLGRAEWPSADGSCVRVSARSEIGMETKTT